MSVVAVDAEFCNFQVCCFALRELQFEIAIETACLLNCKRRMSGNNISHNQSAFEYQQHTAPTKTQSMTVQGQIKRSGFQLNT